VPLAVQAIRAGAADFLEKPFDDEVLLESVRRALIVSRAGRNQTVEAQKAIAILEQLSERERVVLGRLVQGESNKQVGHALGISPRTVEVHRARILEKTKAQGLAGLVRIARAAEGLSRATT
jgi:two-component system response regulator FixJ